MARTQLPNLTLPRSHEGGLVGSGPAFDKPFTAGMRAVGIAGEGCLGYDRWVQARATSVTSEGHYDQLVRRQRAELQDAYLKGVRRLRWDAGRLAGERERRLRELLVYAAERSPFWRERLAGRDLANFTEADLPSLPVLTRAEMMTQFDRVVTDPRLTLARIQQHLDQPDGDRGYMDDQYQAIITSGYIGTQAVHV